MKIFIIFLGLTVSILASAEEVVPFKVSLYQQTCRRPTLDLPFDCRTSGLTSVPLLITLIEVTPERLEEKAFQGVSEEISLSVGSSGQYVVKATVRKGIYASGKLTEYKTKLEVYQMSQAPTIYQTTITSGEPILATPTLLMADRRMPSDNFFEQNYFKLGN